MIVLFDTDVILDLLLDRVPFSEAAAQVLSRVERGDLRGYVCATTVTTLYYLMGKAAGAIRAKKNIQKVFSILEVAPVNRTVLESALAGKFDDFEDGVLSEAAHHVGARAIITRNVKHYRSSKVPAYPPIEILDMMIGKK